MSQITVENIKRSTETASRSTRGVAAAWVNFDGTGTIAARDSENVSSLTDDGAGLYTVNYSSNMANANCGISGSGGSAVAQSILATRSLTASSVGVRTTNTTTSADNAEVHVKTHGDLA